MLIRYLDYAQVMSSQNNWVYMNDVCLQKKIEGRGDERPQQDFE